MIPLLFTDFIPRKRVSITGLDVRVETRDWTAKDVVGYDSFDEKSGYMTIVSKRSSTASKKSPLTYQLLAFHRLSTCSLLRKFHDTG